MAQPLRTTRRTFLAGAGTLSFAILANGTLSVFPNDADAQTQDNITSLTTTAWVTIFSDDRVMIRFGAPEMGQGVNTSLPMIIAEEMDADWSTVSVEQVSQDPDRVFGNPSFGGTLFAVGSGSLEGYFPVLRKAGATARRILIHSAASAWGVPPDQVTTEPGAAIHVASERRMRYGEIAASVIPITDVPEVADTDLKPRQQWRIMGTDLDRQDIPDKTRGGAIYSIDVRLPGMLFAAQLLSPVEGETPTIISDVDALDVRGVVSVIALENSVAILAETWEAALAARDLLQVEWTQTSPFRDADSAGELEELRAAAEDVSREAVVWEARGDAASALTRTNGRVITSHFTTEHVYHAQMEPLNAVVSVDADGNGADVWLGTQAQTISISIAARVLGTTPDRIRFHAMQMGGAFGRRTVFARDILRDALLLSREAGRPVKLMWTREDDVKNSWLRPATVHRLEALLDAAGNVTAMRHRVASPSIIEFAFPDRWDAQTRRDSLIMEGAESAVYAISNLVAEHVVTPRRSRVAAWRGIGWGPNCFARECFMDELAEEAGIDPVTFRRNLLRSNPRGLGVLNAVVKMSNFGNAPEGRAHGLSYAGYKTTYGAGVAEVSTDAEGEGLRIHKFWAAVDPGTVIHPVNYIAQAEGGILFGLSSLLRERATFTGGVIDQNNFYDYMPMRIDDAPEIEVQLIESGAPPSGGGEIGVPMTGAAVANALRHITGERPRQIPFGGSQS